MKSKANSAVILCSVIMMGCAAKPENIPPAYVSHIGYTSWDCQQLREEQTRLVSALSTASDAQRQARSNDIAGVILIGLPVSSLSGANQASNIARLKGELDALQKAMIQEKCGGRIIEAHKVTESNVIKDRKDSQSSSFDAYHQ